MTLGPILGNPSCPHDNLKYYHSGYSGNYAVCDHCGGHLWGATEEGIEVPKGRAVIDLDSWEDDDDDDTPDHPVADQIALQKWLSGVESWNVESHEAP